MEDTERSLTSNSLYKSRLIALYQKNRASHRDIARLLDSKRFAARYCRLTGEEWNKSKEVAIADDFLGLVAFLCKCFEWQETYGKHFSYTAARRSYQLHRVILGYSPSESITEALNTGLSSYRAALGDLDSLSGSSKRRVLQALATPDWRDHEQIKDIYRERDALNAKYGKGSYHVDHEIPISNSIVCGLHVHQNLRVIPAAENCSKNNSFTIEA